MAVGFKFTFAYDSTVYLLFHEVVLPLCRGWFPCHPVYVLITIAVAVVVAIVLAIVIAVGFKFMFAYDRTYLSIISRGCFATL